MQSNVLKNRFLNKDIMVLQEGTVIEGGRNSRNRVRRSNFCCVCCSHCDLVVQTSTQEKRGQENRDGDGSVWLQERECSADERK